MNEAMLVTTHTAEANCGYWAIGFPAYVSTCHHPDKLEEDAFLGVFVGPNPGPRPLAKMKVNHKILLLSTILVVYSGSL